MLILTCFIILKYWGHKYRLLSGILVVMILLLLIFLIENFLFFLENIDKGKKEEWVSIQGFSNILEINKEGKLQSYPTTSILSDIDGEILSINVVTGDIVQQYDILIHIKNTDGISIDYDVGEIFENTYKKYDDIEKEYNKFEIENGNKIKELEQELFNKHNALIHAIELNDKEGIKILENDINHLSNEYEKLKIKQEDLENTLNFLDNEIKTILNKSDKYYYELEKQTPRSPFKGVISNIYVGEGDFIKNGDILLSIINNNYTPEIFVSLDFNEYLLTKDLTGVNIILENENWGNFEYSGEIYSRSPILNDEGKYTITIKIIENNVSDLILSDENTNINVIFGVNSDLVWIPDNCFKKIGNTNGVLSLRENSFIIDKKVNIQSKWNGWNNVEDFILYSLENRKEKDGIELLCYIE